MSRLAEARPLTVEAAWLLDEARALAASGRRAAFDTTHLLAAALRSDTTFGAALRRTSLVDRSDDLDRATRGPSHRRTTVASVEPAADIGTIIDAAAKGARRDGRAAVDAEDLVWALTTVLGPHSRFFAGDEPKMRVALAATLDRRDRRPRRVGRTSKALETAGCVVSLAWTCMTVLLTALSAGVTILVAGAGIVLHHAAVGVAGVLFRFRATFRGWSTGQIGGRLETDRALSTREVVVATLVVRTAMALVAIGTFGFVLLELRGVGLSPSTRFTQDPTSAFGPVADADVNLLLLLFFGHRPAELWIAIGAAFMAIPPFGEVDRVRELLAAGSRRSRAVARALGPLRSMTWVFDRFDAIGAVVGLPTMISSGMAGVVLCALAGSLLADLAISIVA
jgi:hypothetical protein